MSAKTLLAGDPALLTEAQFSDLVREVATLGGWTLRYHTWSSRKSPSGFPDFVLVHREDRRIIFAELKTESGKTTTHQDEWLEALGRVPGLEVHLWRPSDWPTIVGELTGRWPA